MTASTVISEGSFQGRQTERHIACSSVQGQTIQNTRIQTTLANITSTARKLNKRTYGKRKGKENEDSIYCGTDDIRNTRSSPERKQQKEVTLIYSDNEKKEFKMRGNTDDIMTEIAGVLRAFRKAASSDYGFEVSDLLIQWIVEMAYTTNDKDIDLVNKKMRAKLKKMLGGKRN